MFEVGQTVWDVTQGEGIVQSIKQNAVYPVHVKFDGKDVSTYTTNGKYRKEDENPSLYPHPVEITMKPTKPSINWEHVNPKFKYLAQDSDGDVWLYTEKPTLAITVWAASGEIVDPRMFASYVEGTCDWKESLVKRPEGENHDD